MKDENIAISVRNISKDFGQERVLKGVSRDFEKGKIEHPSNLLDNTKRIGQKNKMNCGMVATIINYRKSNDIDVEFEDGVVIEKRSYQDFLKGKISHPKLKNNEIASLGITRKMHCGINATIIAYRKSDDIDVQFDDGVVVSGCSLSAFKGSRILHPKLKIIKSAVKRPMHKESSQEGINRIGEKRAMHCGMEATIVAYHTSKNIDVRFDDGTIVQNKSYGNFKTGRIDHPMIKPSASYPERVISGFLRAAGIPFIAEWSDPVLRGENKKKPLYFDFAILDGDKICLLIEYQGVQHFKELERFGGKQSFSRQQKHDDMKRYYAAANGIHLMEIPFDIYTFDEIVDFLNASFPRYDFLFHKYVFPIAKEKIDVVDLNITRIGETKEMHCGMEASVISYRSSADIDVQFEDGSIVCNVSYRRFCLGEVKPNDLKYKNQIANSRLGEIKTMKCGMNATIVRYGSAFDIDVQFEDGTKRTRQNYSNFISGQIGNPNIAYVRSTSAERIGLAKMMKCGMSATVIAYRKHNDIDVLFENGEIAVGKSFANFQRGAIAYPSYMNTEYRLGETQKMNCGMGATIIKYRSSSDIDIRFEDGTVLCSKSYDAFRRGEITNPSIFKSRLNEIKMMNCGMLAKIIEYRKSNDIDVQFEDGTIVKHRSYSDFVKSSIANPNLYHKK